MTGSLSGMVGTSSVLLGTRFKDQRSGAVFGFTGPCSEDGVRREAAPSIPESLNPQNTYWFEHFRVIYRNKLEVEHQRFIDQSVINNACESMRHEGTITLSAENITRLPAQDQRAMTLPDGRYVRVRIEDDGAGILHTLLPKIFEPYFSTKEKGVGKGVGLSLSISYSIVQQHGGPIAAAPNPGGGASINILLPVELPSSEPQSGLLP